MTSKDPSTAAAEAAARELVKVAYGDLLQPAAREVGTELQEFVRAIVIAGRGFGYLIRETYEPFVLKALSRVENKILPSSHILGNVLEAISYEPSGTLLHEMFEGLLAASMDTSLYKSVHPSFPSIVKSLSPDEARLLVHIKNQSLIKITLHELPHVHNSKVEVFITDKIRLDTRDDIEFYVQQLFLHGLLAWDTNKSMWVQHNDRPSTQTELILSTSGQRLMTACCFGA